MSLSGKGISEAMEAENAYSRAYNKGYDAAIKDAEVLVEALERTLGHMLPYDKDGNENPIVIQVNEALAKWRGE